MTLIKITSYIILHLSVITFASLMGCAHAQKDKEKSQALWKAAGIFSIGLICGFLYGLRF